MQITKFETTIEGWVWVPKVLKCFFFQKILN